MEIIKRKNANGITKYREKFYINGKCINSPIFIKKTDAKAWKARKITEREKVKALGQEIKILKKIKFKDYATTWVEGKIKALTSQSTYNSYKDNLRLHIFPVILDLNIDQITLAHANTITQNLVIRGLKEASINKVLQIFKSIVIEAEKNDVILKNPLRNYSKLKIPKRPPAYWNKCEINQFLRVNLNDELYPVYVVVLNTGLRRGELAALMWDKVNFDTGFIEVARTRDRYGLREKTKNGITRHVPINGITRAILLKLYHSSNSDFVFTHRDSDPLRVHHLYRDFRNAQRRATMKLSIRFHDTRHTFASHFMMNGGNLYDLQKILGHSKIDMTQIYAHLSPEHLQSATKIISFGEIRNNEKSSPDIAQREIQGEDSKLLMMAK